MYTITEQGVRDLEIYIQEIPYKYAIHILKILNTNLVKLEEQETKNGKK